MSGPRNLHPGSLLPPSVNCQMSLSRDFSHVLSSLQKLVGASFHFPFQSTAFHFHSLFAGCRVTRFDHNRMIINTIATPCLLSRSPNVYIHRLNTSSILQPSMSDALVPCRDHPGLPMKRRGHEMISLEVGLDSDSEVLDAPLRHLRNTSDYFNYQSVYIISSPTTSLWRFPALYHTKNIRRSHADLV